MKKKFFLLQKNKDGFTRTQSIIYDFFMPLMLVISAVICGVLSLMLAYGQYERVLFYSYFSNPFILFLNILPTVLMSLVLWGLCGRAWIANLVSSVITLGFTSADYYLLKFRDDPLLFSDVMYVREAAQINSRYDMTPGKRMIFAYVICIVLTVLLFFFARKKPKAGIRIPVTVIAVLLAFVPVKNLYTDAYIYDVKTANYEYINHWSSTQNFVSKGFVYPFLHSVSDAFPKAPDGYSEKAAKEILSAYTDSDIPEEKRVDIIAVMLEAYNDLTLLGVDGIDQSVYKAYHDLLDECYHGRLVTNIFAGGTIDTERAFLTGYSTLGNFRHDTNSYVRYLESQNYYADGSHPCYRWFYNRINVNNYLGFKNYYFYEDYYSTLSSTIAVDSIVFPEIKNFYDREKDSGQNYFGFHVTYQGHGPYSAESLDWVSQPVFSNPAVGEASSVILNNYLGSVSNTAENIVNLVNELKKEDKPVLFVFFGDHKPWLGDGNSVYNELGVDLDVSEYDGFMNYYSTEYAIFANDAAKELLGDDFVGTGPTISPCFLMNELFSECSYEGNAYMKFTNYVRSLLPVINKNGFIDENGNFYTDEDDLDEQHKEALHKFRIVEKYVSDNFSK